MLPSCAPLVPIRTRVARYTAHMGPMAAMRIGPGSPTEAGIAKPASVETGAAAERLGGHLGLDGEDRRVAVWTPEGRPARPAGIAISAPVSRNFSANLHLDFFMNIALTKALIERLWRTG